MEPVVPKTEFSQEIRFAVVMYGGSSLAIYMNGVAQELLRLVRATAERPGGENIEGALHRPDARGSERVYRELGQMLVRGRPPRRNVKPEDSVRSRFVIDIICGTSAGGINGVFLAKALANDQDLSKLQDLWVKTADFDRLLNDKQGKASPQKNPKSLVNSPLMYAELYHALADMEKQRPSEPGWISPYAEELDLFTTFTDVNGQVLSLQLEDVTATERKHLHNFHFSYQCAGQDGKPVNDFTGANDPFLAFAARATSAHQAAFEPVALADIELERQDPSTLQWRKFYEEYLQPARVRDPGQFTNGDRSDIKSGLSPDKLAEEFQRRPLVDGGTLDNSPFSFAIDQLRTRHVRLPVDRKLVYIEPAPEHSELHEAVPGEKPDAIVNAVMGLSTLPMYQFIRDDLRRIFERNQLIRRVNRILQGTEKDHAQKRTADVATVWPSYLRLRVGETTDTLAHIVSSAAGFSAESDESTAIWYLVRAWRSRNFAPIEESASTERQSEVRFLQDFDIRHAIRRLKFVLRKAGEVSCFDVQSTGVVQAARGSSEGERWESGRQVSQFRKTAREQLFQAVQRISGLLKTLETTYSTLVSPARTYETHDGANAPPHPLARAISDLALNRADLFDLLRYRTDQARLAAADAMLRKRQVAFDALHTTVVSELHAISQSEELLDKIIPKADEVPILATLRFYYDHFSRYDVVSYPILYSTDAGEELDPVEVFRISPQDVKRPIHNAQKLAGLSLGHFGALMDERFRVNDILWGRLDCAERLITLLLHSAPAPENAAEQAELEQKCADLIREAQQAIVIEAMADFDQSLKEQLGLDATLPSVPPALLRKEVVAELATKNVSAASREYIESQFRENDPLEKFAANYKVLTTVDARKLVHIVGRASRILGKMLDDIADQYRSKNPIIMWVTRLMRVFWGLVEVALPNSAANLVGRHLLNMLYLFEVLLVVAGIVLSQPAMTQLGLVAFGITLAANFCILLIEDVASQRALADVGSYQNRWARALKGFVAFVAIAIVLINIVLLAAFLRVNFLWNLIESARTYIHGVAS